MRGASGVRSVTADLHVSLSSTGPDGTDPADLGSLRSVVQMIGADRYWHAGYTGAGVDVAVIDSGVAPVDGLSVPGKVVNGPDLSFESQDPDLRYLDTYGHGTHMAGIIAGNDTGACRRMARRPPTPFNPTDRTTDFMGVAPGARIVSLKVADAFGATDVSQVLVAIDWVITHRHDGDAGLNIRVLNLSFGTNGTQAYTLDPLAYAVEQAWKKGIFVVVSAGNEGYGTTKLNDPAYDPYIMAVGASDPEGTANPADDTVAAFSSGGDATRHPDVVAPGTSILEPARPRLVHRHHLPHGARRRHAAPVPRQRHLAGHRGGVRRRCADHPAAPEDHARPAEAPAQRDGHALAGPRPTADGNGQVNLDAAYARTRPRAHDARQDYKAATGLGTLDGSRGSFRITDDGVALQGNTDIFGNPINLKRWARLSATGDAWDKGAWMGVDYTGRSWTGRSWTGIEWSGPQLDRRELVGTLVDQRRLDGPQLDRPQLDRRRHGPAAAGPAAPGPATSGRAPPGAIDERPRLVTTASLSVSRSAGGHPPALRRVHPDRAAGRCGAIAIYGLITGGRCVRRPRRPSRGGRWPSPTPWPRRSSSTWPSAARRTRSR